MAGYSYYHISMRSQISGGQPFAPFVPSQFNRNDPPQGYVTKKKIVPVTSRPYHDRDDDDEDEWNHRRQSSPARGHPSNAYGDNMGNKQSIGSTIHKPDDGYNNGIGYGKKEGTKLSSVGAITNDNHDGYNNGYRGRKPTESSTLRPNNKYDGTNYGYGNYGGGNKEGRNPVEIPIKKDNYGEYGNLPKKDNYDSYGGGYENPAIKDNYGAYSGYGNPVKKDDYGVYGNPVKKDDYGAFGNPVKEDDYGAHGNPVKDNYGAYGGYGSPTKKDNYQGYGGYKEGPKSKPKPSSSPIYNNGYGGYGHEKPFGIAISPTGDSGNKDNGNTYYNNKPTPGWSATKLSKPTNDIDKAIGLLKDEAANRGYNGGHKPLESESDNNPHQRIYDGPGPLSSRPVQVDKKGMDLVNETERLKKINVPVIKDNRPRSNFSDGRSSGYGVINHIEAEKRFKGMTI